MNGIPVKQSLLSELQGHLSADLFASATPVRRAADEVLFVAAMPATVAIGSKMGWSRLL